MAEKPKVLVGCPVSDYHAYSTDEYLEAVKNLSYSNYDILLIDNSKTDRFYNYLKSLDVPVVRDFFSSEDVKKKIVACRNLLREKALEKYDYFLSLEQDVVPPKDVIERLLKHKKNIVTGIYYSYYTVLNKVHALPVLYREPTEEEKEGIKKRSFGED